MFNLAKNPRPRPAPGIPTVSLVATTIGLVMFCPGPSVGMAERPNVLWISCEDLSPHLGCYGDPHARTPRLDQLAGEGIRYDHAFTCHGVCAPSRTGIITGVHPIVTGTNHMRCRARLPEHIHCFPTLLREAGYYCTNNAKTDYNFPVQMNMVWDDNSGTAHWRNRPDPEQPFFAVFNIGVTHESRIWPDRWQQSTRRLAPGERQNPREITVPPIYPPTSEVQAAHARLLDLVTILDQKVGELLDELEQAGLRDNTIVMFWSDHGNGFPRAKRTLYDSGTRVPLIVRIPAGWPAKTDHIPPPGSVDSRLVSLVDLGPTVLGLAGLPRPEYMTGRPFLGTGEPARAFVGLARDRIDERFDLVRSVRTDRYRYLRNYQTWRPALPHVRYAENSVVRQALRNLPAAESEWSELTARTRPFEELYDLQADPWETRNLADAPEFQKQLQQMSGLCDRWMRECRDVHLIPEAMLETEGQQAGTRWNVMWGEGPAGPERLEKLLKIARDANLPGEEMAESLTTNVQDPDPAIRWWAMMGLGNRPDVARRNVDRLREGTRDPSPSVRIAAARSLHRAGETRDAVDILISHLDHESPFVRHAALHELDEIGPPASTARPAVQSLIAEGGDLEKLGKHALNQWLD